MVYNEAMAPDLADYITVKEAATELEISTSRVRQLILEGRLPATKIGEGRAGIWLINPDDLDLVRERKWGRPPNDDRDS